MSTELEAVVRQSLETTILNALKSAPEAIDAMVHAALIDKKVDSVSGRIDGYHGTKVPYLEYLTGEAIRSAADASIRKLVAEMAPQIEQTIRSQLTSETVVQAFLKTLLRSTESEWQLRVEFGKERE